MKNHRLIVNKSNEKINHTDIQMNKKNEKLLASSGIVWFELISYGRFQNGDKFGFTIVDASRSDMEFKYINKQCTWSNDIIRTGIYFEDYSETITFTVYYPYFSDVNSQGYKIINTNVVQTSSAKEQLNILAGETYTYYGKEDAQIQVYTITPILEITIQLGSGFDPNEISSTNWRFYISGLKHEGTFNVKTRAVSADSNASIINEYEITNGEYTNDVSRGTRVYNVYVLAQKYEELTLKATINGETFYKRYDSAEIKILIIHYYNFTLNRPTNTFTKSNTFTESNTFLNNKSLTHSFVLIQTITNTKTLLINTFLSQSLYLTFSNLKSYFTYSEFIFYKYTIIQYLISYSFYSNYYFIINENKENVQNDNEKNILIIICVVIMVISIVCSILFVYISQRKYKKNSPSFEENESNEENEGNVIDKIINFNMNQIEEDPFANDFKDNKFDNHIQI